MKKCLVILSLVCTYAIVFAASKPMGVHEPISHQGVHESIKIVERLPIKPHDSASQKKVDTPSSSSEKFPVMFAKKVFDVSDLPNMPSKELSKQDIVRLMNDADLAERASAKIATMRSADEREFKSAFYLKNPAEQTVFERVIARRLSLPEMPLTQKVRTLVDTHPFDAPAKGAFEQLIKEIEKAPVPKDMAEHKRFLEDLSYLTELMNEDDFTKRESVFEQGGIKVDAFKKMIQQKREYLQDQLDYRLMARTAWDKVSYQLRELKKRGLELIYLVVGKPSEALIAKVGLTRADTDVIVQNLEKSNAIALVQRLDQVKKDMDKKIRIIDSVDRRIEENHEKIAEFNAFLSALKNVDTELQDAEAIQKRQQDIIDKTKKIMALQEESDYLEMKKKAAQAEYKIIARDLPNQNTVLSQVKKTANSAMKSLRVIKQDLATFEKELRDGKDDFLADVRNFADFAHLQTKNPQKYAYYQNRLEKKLQALRSLQKEVEGVRDMLAEFEQNDILKPRMNAYYDVNDATFLLGANKVTALSLMQTIGELTRAVEVAINPSKL